MRSRYYFINFKNLKIRTPNIQDKKNLWCGACQNNGNRNCNCVYYTGNTSLPDRMVPNGTIVGGIGVKSEKYYDEIVSQILKWNGEINA